MKNLAAAIVAVMSEVGSLPKDGTNDFSNYSFTTEAMVVNTLRPLMVKHGLALIPHEITVASETQTGEKMRRVAISATYMLLHASGESITVTVPGEGMDSLDKSTAKALTGALKYLMIQLFLVGRGEDGDTGKGYESDDMAAAGFPPPAKPKQDDGGYVLTFGKHKGQSIRNVDMDYLKWLLDVTQADLSDPRKKAYSINNKKRIDLILDEVNRRAKNASDDYDDAPFGQ